MQNRYVGDFGDFGKYGLLRSLCGVSGVVNSDQSLRLGIVWYLHPDESHNSDGKYTGYLAPSSVNHVKFRECDPELYDALHMTVINDERHVASVRESEVFPDSTIYFEPSLYYPHRQSRNARQTARENWLLGALATTIDADLVFVDPDNGIAPESVKPLHKKGPKYVFMDDLRQFVERGQSLIIYHHLGRRSKAVEQIRGWAGDLQRNLNLARLPQALWYHRGTARAYFIIAQERHKAVLSDRLDSFVSGPWGERKHFELVDCTEI